MKNFFSLPQCLLFFTALLFSFKSLATCSITGTPPNSSYTCLEDISRTDSHGFNLFDYENGNNNSITNTVNIVGNITTDGVSEQNHGVYLYFDMFGDTNSVLNSINMNGNISTYSLYSSAIRLVNSSQATGNILNSATNILGNISTFGDNSKGMLLNNTSFSFEDPPNLLYISTLNSLTNSVNMTGNISTSGEESIGIYLANDSYGASSNNTMTNNVNIIGNISMTGNYSDGIFLVNKSYDTSSNNTMTNNVNIVGNISMTGNNSTGINLVNYFYNTSSNNTMTNNVNIVGNISMTGDNSYGIYLENAGGSSNTNNVNMKGNITTTGYQAHGVVLGGDNSTFNSYGLIKVTGESAYAIHWRLGGSNGVVNLKRGSVIIGDIVAGDHENARLNINLGSGASYAYSVSSNLLVSDLDNRPMVTGSAYAAGVGAQETAAEMLYQRTSVVNSALDRRLRAYAYDDAENQPYWLDVYYSDVTRNAGGNYSTKTAFSNYNYGMTAGFKLPVQFTPLELVVNVEQNNLNIDSGNQRIDSSSIMAGFLAPSITEVFGAKLSAKALVGYADHDGDRKVMTNSLLYDGSRQIKSDYNSIYAVLGTALTKLYPITNRLTADVILGLDLNTQRFESYKETDYFVWDSRTLTQLQSRVQTGLDYKLWGDKGSVFARVGAEHRDLIGGATQDYAINGTNVSFNTNNKNDTYLTAQVGVRAQLEKRIQLFGVVNTLHSSDSVNSVSGNIGLIADF
jgi:hypothetical protein